MIINNGDRVRDKVTGFEGIVTSRTTYINGCARIGVQGPKNKDGTIPEPACFDELQVEIVKAAEIKGVQPRLSEEAKSVGTGGPGFVPKQRDSVRRMA